MPRGSVHRPHPSPPIYRSGYYRPYYRPYYGVPYYGYGYGSYFGVGVGFYGTWWGGAYGYGPYWPGYYGYGFYPPYPYPYGYAYDYRGAARLQVQPRNAEVFIDGHLVGTVDDFDGWAQRLHVEPGGHELTIYLDGHRTYREKVLLRPGATLNIQHVMQPLAPGETPEARPVPEANARPSGPAREARPEPRRRSSPPPASVEVSADYGSVAVRVQPFDAEVIVDGDRWSSPEAGDLTLQLSEGAHRVEVRREGFRTYSAEIRVRRAETTSLNVSLSRQ